MGATLNRTTAFPHTIVVLAPLLLVAWTTLGAQEPRPGRIGHMVFADHLGAPVYVEADSEKGVQKVWWRPNGGWARLGDDGPRARELEGAAYDSRRKRLLLHGGMVADGGDTSLDEFWAFDGTRWTPLTATGPGTRDHHAIAYDLDRDRLVLFGGRVTRDRLGTDTWEFDGVSWKRFDVPGPGGRAHFAMAYDATNRRTLLFGGMNQENRVTSELWAWDGRAWEKLADAGPPPRSHHRMAIDANDGSLVLFGGQRGMSALGDTWVWKDGTWREVAASPDGPGKRGGHTMTYDKARQRIVMFGGSYFDGRTSHQHADWWEWDRERQQWMRVVSDARGKPPEPTRSSRGQ